MHSKQEFGRPPLDVEKEGRGGASRRRLEERGRIDGYHAAEVSRSDGNRP